jgi:hypothetical protein
MQVPKIFDPPAAADHFYLHRNNIIKGSHSYIVDLHGRPDKRSV